MIVTRTPFRISFAGGGRLRVSYSKTEMCDSVEELEHPIVKECLKTLGMKTGLEIVSIADIPGQTGLGSSSSFTVGLLTALHAYSGRFVCQDQLARQACEIEIERLREPIGKQDQYIAAYGGLQFLRFLPDGSVFADPVICAPEAKRELQRRLMLFFAGGTRAARTVLMKQNAKTVANMDSLRRLCQIASEMREVLTVGRDLNTFGHLLHDAWQVKKSLEATISNARIDDLYERAMRAGALGGKLLGAGTSGFLLFYCEPHYQTRLRDELAELPQIPFSFDSQGTAVIYVGDDQW